MNLEPIIQTMSKLATDLWLRDWIESNGGNVSWRLPEDLATGLNALPAGISTELPVSFPELAGEFFCVSAAGSHLRNIPLMPERTLGIVRLTADGSRYQRIWGLEGDGRPTSEFGAHLGAHHAIKRKSNNVERVVVHTHPANAIALTHTQVLESRTLTRLLWQMHTECIMVFPEGLAYIPVRVPGSKELAEDTRRAMEECTIAVWQHHGVFASGKDPDQAFGRVHVVEKAAEVCLKTMAACGGTIPVTINDEELRAIAAIYGPNYNRNYL